MKTLQEIQATLVKHKDQLFSNYPIESLAIFGSFARNEQRDDSDLDIIVEFNDKIGIRFIDLADELERLVGFKVDLISKKASKTNIINQSHPTSFMSKREVNLLLEDMLESA